MAYSQVFVHTTKGTGVTWNEWKVRHDSTTIRSGYLSTESPTLWPPHAVVVWQLTGVQHPASQRQLCVIRDPRKTTVIC